MSAKATLREEARARLARLDPVERMRYGARIEQAVWEIPEVRNAKLLLLYASVGSEVPTDSIALEAVRRGIAIAYPRTVAGANRLTLHDVSSPLHLIEGGRYGIREPDPAAEEIAIESVDAAFVPGLAWDEGGYRLGRGAGYYDRLFAATGWRGFRCGLFFLAQRFASLPHDPWDERLDAIVTEEGVVRFTRTPRPAPP